jgi:hypothetical protein
MKDLARLLGKSRTPLSELFSEDGSGWIDRVGLKQYPTLSSMRDYLLKISDLKTDDLGQGPFQFPRSLDDFGLEDFFSESFPGKYSDYLEQWADSDEEVVESQILIQTDCQHLFPNKSENCLYLLVGNIEDVDRVMYVGKAKNGMMMRFFNGPKIGAQNNNYIGDCRSYESRKKPNYTWRAKSAELRRRGICKVSWTILPSVDLERVESSLIKRKRELISEVTGLVGVKDPVNSRE